MSATGVSLAGRKKSGRGRRPGLSKREFRAKLIAILERMANELFLFLKWRYGRHV
jgi:hypothetical protein